MSTNTALQNAETLLARWNAGFARPEANRLDVALPAADLSAAVQALWDQRWGYLAAITGLDCGPEADRIEVLYHFCAGAAVLTLRAQLARSSPTVTSICPMIPPASIFEREVAEMLGVTFLGAPDDTRLFLAEDWPDQLYPLRKDAPLPAVPPAAETME